MHHYVPGVSLETENLRKVVQNLDVASSSRTTGRHGNPQTGTPITLPTPGEPPIEGRSPPQAPFEHPPLTEGQPLRLSNIDEEDLQHHQPACEEAFPLRQSASSGNAEQQTAPEAASPMPGNVTQVPRLLCWT